MLFSPPFSPVASQSLKSQHTMTWALLATASAGKPAAAGVNRHKALVAVRSVSVVFPEWCESDDEFPKLHSSVKLGRLS